MIEFNSEKLTELEGSAISRDIADLNIVPLDGDRALDAIFHALGNDERINSGRVCDKWLRRYDHIRKYGGLAFYGVDIEGNRSECITFKPAQPLDADRKYENPPKAPTQAIYPAVNYRIWKKIADRYGVEMPPAAAAANPADEAKAFWLWMRHVDIPVIITEGAKKTLAAISAGFACIGLIGIWNGVRANKNENGKTIEYKLDSSLWWLGDEARTTYIAFDRDTKAATIKNVTLARSVLAKQLIDCDCLCYSIRWDDYKGLDDLLAGCGVEALEQAIDRAEELTGEAPDPKHPIYPNFLAEKIAKEWQGKVCYELTTRIWRIYKSGEWVSFSEDEMGQVFYKRILEDVPALKSQNYVNNVIAFTKYTLGVGKWAEGNSVDYLPFNNGVWSFADRVLLPHSPDHRLTWKLDRNYSPVATEWDAIDRFLSTITQDNERLKNLLIASCAAVLTGRSDLHKALYLFGGGRNGKGTFLRLLEMLVGDSNSHSTDLGSLCENRFEVANLHGKRLVVCADEDRRIRGFSTFKKITGGDFLRGEEKGLKAFKFQFQGMAVLASNEPIFIGDNSYGLSRRLISIPFEYTIPTGQERDLTPEFRSDLPSFTTYLLNLDRQWVTDTLRHAQAIPKIKDLEWELATRTDSIASYYDDRLIFDAEAKIPAATLYQDYRNYCLDMGFSPKHQNNFCPSVVNLCEAKLKQKVKSYKTNYGKVIQGLRLRTPLDPIGDDRDGSVTTNVTTPETHNQAIEPKVTTVTTVTTENDFSEKTDPKPPTFTKIEKSAHLAYFTEGDRIISSEIVFDGKSIGEEWRQFLEMNGIWCHPIHTIERDGRRRWLLIVKNLNLSQIDLLADCQFDRVPSSNKISSNLIRNA
jgi:putative DNA primase/helicase